MAFWENASERRRSLLAGASSERSAARGTTDLQVIPAVAANPPGEAGDPKAQVGESRPTPPWVQPSTENGSNTGLIGAAPTLLDQRRTPGGGVQPARKRLARGSLADCCPLPDSPSSSDSTSPSNSPSPSKGSAERLREVLDLYAAVCDGLIIHRNGIIVETDEQLATMLGYSPAELVGTEVADHLNQQSDEVLLQHQSGQPRNRYMATAIDRGGARFPVELTANQGVLGGDRVQALAIRRIAQGSAQSGPLLHAGESVGAEIHGTLTRHQDRARRSQKLESLGLLSGRIAHDFNNLLVSIMGNAELGTRLVPRGSQLHQVLADVHTAAIRASQLTDQMLAYSGERSLRFTAVDVREVIREVLHLLHRAVSKKIELRFEFEPTVPLVQADAIQLHQLLMNLIVNASEAIGDVHGTIAVSVREQRDPPACVNGRVVEPIPEGLPTVAVTVRDSGCGMDPATQRRIFDPFFTTKRSGTGLGLAACLGIVREHKGGLHVSSQVGSGTQFDVYLPADPAAPAEQKPLPEQSVEWRGSGRVLVVDDEPSVARVTGMVLTEFGFEADVVCNGRDAVARIIRDAQQLRVVLLDMTMPDLNGVEVLREVRRAGVTVPIVLTSGYSKGQATSRFGASGFVGYLQKPYRLQELVQLLRSVLDD